MVISLVDGRILFAAPWSHEITYTIEDRSTAFKYLREEGVARESWHTKHPMPDSEHYLISQHEADVLAEERTLAVGFWLFPPDAFGETPDAVPHDPELFNSLRPHNKVIVVSNHRPQLCLFNLQ